MTSHEQLDEARLWAFVDGETGLDETRRILAAISEDAALAERIDEMIRDTVAIREAMDTTLPASPPAALRRTVEDAVERSAARAASRSRINFLRWAGPFAAAAAAIALAVGIGDWLGERRLNIRLGELAARSTAEQTLLAQALQEGLERRLSGETENVSSVEIGFSAKLRPIRTYRSQSGHWCRDFVETIGRAEGDYERQGVACRINGSWRRMRTVIEGDEAGRQL